MDAPSASGRSSSSEGSFSSFFQWVDLRVGAIADLGGLSGEEALAERMLNAAAVDDIVEMKKLACLLKKKGENVATVVDALVAKPHFKGRGLLHVAAGYGHIHMCNYLIETLHLDLHAGDANGSAPLLFAVHSRNKQVVELLLSHGADINKANRTGFTALHEAVLGSYEIAELLLSRKAYVDPICENGTPLHIAVVSGKSNMLALLLKHEANPNRVVKSEGRFRKDGFDITAGMSVTPLAIAARDGFTDCVNDLLKAGADANISDENHRLPVEIAAIHGQRECVEILFSYTSPVSKFASWSVDGIIKHVDKDGYVLKAKEDAAFQVKDYTKASAHYTKAIETGPIDTTPGTVEEEDESGPDVEEEDDESGTDVEEEEPGHDGLDLNVEEPDLEGDNDLTWLEVYQIADLLEGVQANAEPMQVIFYSLESIREGKVAYDIVQPLVRDQGWVCHQIDELAMVRQMCMHLCDLATELRGFPFEPHNIDKDTLHMWKFRCDDIRELEGQLRQAGITTDFGRRIGDLFLDELRQEVDLVLYEDVELEDLFDRFDLLSIRVTEAVDLPMYF